MSRPIRLVLLLVFAACGQGANFVVGQAWCLGDGMCSGGQICVHEHAHDGDWDACFTPCGANGACPSGTTRSICPDSPSGDACTRDDGRTKACFCR